MFGRFAGSAEAAGLVVANARASTRPASAWTPRSFLMAIEFSARPRPMASGTRDAAGMGVVGGVGFPLRRRARALRSTFLLRLEDPLRAEPLLALLGPDRIRLVA